MELSKLKPLTTDQYDACHAKALERVQGRIGNKPRRADFQRELGRLWTVLDILALVVFLAAFIVSSVHIIQHMGKLAADSYGSQSGAAGILFSLESYTVIHQLALIFLAEGSMILFLVMFGMTSRDWRKWVYLALSMVALVFVFVANWQSEIGLLESVLAPVFTVGIGLKLEHLIVQSMKRRNEVDKRYLEALNTYEAASKDATQHPDYVPMLRQEVWQKLISLASNKDFKDAPAAFKAAAVRREMERDTWAYDQREWFTHERGDISPVIHAAPVIKSEVETTETPLALAVNGHSNGRH